MNSAKPHLVSFKLCPFVQRSVIMLKEKHVDFDITYIDLDNPPDWFKAISPFGKVPLLCLVRVGSDHGVSRRGESPFAPSCRSFRQGAKPCVDRIRLFTLSLPIHHG